MAHRILRCTIRRFAADRRGAALVEFGITLPFLLMLFGVIIESGRMFWAYQAAITGVRDTTRYVARVVPAEICGTSGTGASLNGYLPVPALNTGPLPASVTIDSVDATLACRAGGTVTYRNDPAPVAIVAADVTLEFPFSGLFTLVGGSLPTVTTTVRDESRIYGT